VELRMLLIRPAEGRQIRRPEPPYGFLPDEPAAVMEHPYWWRRLSRGDVILCDPAVPVAEPNETDARATGPVEE